MYQKGGDLTVILYQKGGDFKNKKYQKKKIQLPNKQLIYLFLAQKTILKPS